ncbi:extracellular tyrosine-protein kinase PKDCC-like [Saccostrea cucullata]|uniref:extracellular tyrosine-protein kinase PKDCC-like n=1 Tax=Saccostrea cuccullata TaxID=36930 RepID=UPI002ED08E11
MMLRVFWRRISVWKLCTFSVIVLLGLNVALHRRFVGLEAESLWNIKDPNGMILTPFSLHGTFENRLRKLMEKSTGNGLDVIKIQNEAPMSVTYSENLIKCEDFVDILNRTYLESGWTKAVYRGNYKGLPVAIKTVDVKGQHLKSCVAKGHRHGDCYHRAAQKIVKEIVVLQAIAHENVIKVLGFCVPGTNSNIQGVAMVTELGESVDLIKILQMSWEDRFKISFDVSSIIEWMASSSYGSLAMNDFRRQQFVLVDGSLKLSDVDDVGFGDPGCVKNEDCTIHFSSSNFTQKIPCKEGTCLNYNEKKNLYNGGRHFTTFLLPHGAPESLRPLVDKVVEGYSNLTLNSHQIVQLMKKIKSLYVSGKYLKRQKQQFSKDYRFYPGSDLPGKFDYRCRLSLSGTGCTHSAFDVLEAAALCDADPDCRGFVVSKQRTWAGRMLVHFKYGFDYPSKNSNTSLYVRIT